MITVDNLTKTFKVPDYRGATWVPDSPGRRSMRCAMPQLCLPSRRVLHFSVERRRKDHHAPHDSHDTPAHSGSITVMGVDVARNRWKPGSGWVSS
jgi:hypothetical protein